MSDDWSQGETWWMLQQALIFAIAGWMLETIPAALGFDLDALDDEDEP